MTTQKAVRAAIKHWDGVLAQPDISAERRAEAKEARALWLRRQEGHCDTCGRELTDAESLRLGRGPECRRRKEAA